jgi:hypothetical protein
MLLTPAVSTLCTQITCAKDLILYSEALRQNRQYVPANTFSYKHPALTFPDALPEELVVEPWVATPQLVLRGGSWEVEQWPDESLPYVEASVGLLGNRGEVEPLAMSFVTRWVALRPQHCGLHCALRCRNTLGPALT